MRHSLFIRLLSGAAIVAGVALAGLPAARAEEPAAAAETETFDPAVVDSFSGAFLAARTADVDKDYKTAIELYRIALQFDPTNTEVKERLMITLLLNGDFDEGVKLAERLSRAADHGKKKGTRHGSAAASQKLDHSFPI